ncbi:MAG: TSUP family transporter [Clostridia bacterium]|nr:TSUP family transporter [Clostridia bacterium]
MRTAVRHYAPALLILPGAFAAGFTNGLLGTGGGILLLYLLKSGVSRRTHRTPPAGKDAYAAVILCVLPLSVLSFLYYQDGGMFEKVPGDMLIPCLCGAVPGGILGALLLDRIRVTTAEYLFAALVLFAGFRMLF